MYLPITPPQLYGIFHIFFLEKLSTYDDVDADIMRNYQEFTLASMLFFGMKEQSCSEQSARMTAMDGASKNAGM